MKFEKIRIKGFRNIEDCTVCVSSKQVLLIGENGQGKTNFLEAVYYLCYGNSFRTHNPRETVKHGESSFCLSAELEDVFSQRKNVQIAFSDAKKSVKIDGREIKDRKDLIYNIPCIVFCNDDINLVRGEPEFRRVFIDQTLSMYDPLYLDDLRRYKAVLKQRNAAIKDGMLDIIDPYNSLLAKYGLRIMQARRDATKILCSLFPEIYSSVASDGRTISFSYRPSWNNLETEEQIVKELEDNLEKDRALQYTTGGIHRDRFVISDQNGPFSVTGSTGQLRLASLALRTAQASFFRSQTGKDPVFLVDDVLLELDSGKRALFLDLMGSYSQAFFTFLPDENYYSKIKEDTLVLNVKEGVFNVQPQQ